MELLTSILLILLLVLMKKLWSMKKRHTRRLPGPLTLEAFKSLLNTSSATGLHIAVSDWSEVYGDIVALTLPGQCIVFLNTADLVKEIFTADTNKYISNDRQGTFATKFVFDNKGLGFLSLGVDHSRLRRLFTTTLARYGEGVTAYEDLAREELDCLINHLSQTGCVDISDVLSKSLMNCIHVLLLGHRAEKDAPSFLAMLQFNDAMNSLLRYELDATLTMFPFLRYIPGYYKTICDNVETSKERLLLLLFDQVKKSPDHDGYICKLVQEQTRREGGEGKGKVTDEQIRRIILDILNAGYMTTRGALLGVFLCLLKYQDIQENMYKEIRNNNGAREVTLEDRAKLPYVEAVILEVLRYTSHTPFCIPHLAREEITTDKYIIPKGSLLVANLWRIHHDDQVFGDSWTFRPERYLDTDGHLLPKDHPVMRKSLPFSIGKRQCPGASFATSRLFLYVANLFQRFKFVQQNGDISTSADPRTWRPGIILHLPKIRCTVENRDNIRFKRNVCKEVP